MSPLLDLRIVTCLLESVMRVFIHPKGITCAQLRQGATYIGVIFEIVGTAREMEPVMDKRRRKCLSRTDLLAIENIYVSVVVKIVVFVLAVESRCECEPERDAIFTKSA
jgi:hypothetical protein